jgi:hypothetical protein
MVVRGYLMMQGWESFAGSGRSSYESLRTSGVETPVI